MGTVHGAVHGQVCSELPLLCDTYMETLILCGYKAGES